jgi:hypothetical protein
MDAYRAHDIQVLPILNYGAAWKNAEAPASDAERREWAEYVRRVVGRYKGFANQWEVWNEPNVLPFWGPRPNVEDYAKLLRVTAEAARDVNPEVRLVAFATAGLDLDFIERTLELAGTDCFDKASYHFYRVLKPEERTVEEVDELRLVLDRFGKQCPIWVTEMGVTSYFKEGASEELQAINWMRQVLLLLGAGVERVFPFTLIDNVDDPGGAWGLQLGMVDLKGRRKPAFHAFRTMIAELNAHEVLGSVYLGENIRAYLFAKRDRPPNSVRRKLVAWSTKDCVDVKFQVDDSVRVPPDSRQPEKGWATFGDFLEYTSLTGENKPIEYDATMARVMLSPSPVYIPVVSDGLERNLRTRWDRSAIMTSPGKTESAQLEVALEGVKPGEIRFLPPDGWIGTRDDLRFSFTVPAGTKPGWFTIRAEIPTGTATLMKDLRVWVRPEVVVSFRPNVTTASREIVTSVTLRGITARPPLHWEFKMSPQVPGVELPSGRVSSSEGETRKPFSLDLSPAFPRAAFEAIRDTTAISFHCDPPLAGSANPVYRIAVTPLLEKAPVIDGDITSEYRDVPRMHLAGPQQVVRGAWANAADAGATISAAWTVDGLFVAADITDDHPMMNKYGAGPDIYKGDCVEVYVAPAGYDGSYLSKPEHGFYHVALSPGMNGAGAAVGDFEKKIPGSRIVAKPREGGYVIEAFIPSAAFGGYKPTRGDIISWDVQLTDRDNFADSEPGGSLMWNGDDMNWFKTLRWALAIVN